MRRGFSLIETLVVMAILGVLTSIGTTAFQTFRQRSQVSAASIMTAQALRQAVLNAQSGRFDSIWGADLSSTGITIYAGPNYAGRLAGSDRLSKFPAVVTLGGTATYSFAKRSGRPTSAGSTSLTISSYSTTITVNPLGTVTN